MILATAISSPTIANVISFVGEGAVLKVFSGNVPVACEDSPGPMLARVKLPVTWLTSGGAKVGAWVEPDVDATGDATYFRIYDSGETTCGLQGTVGDPEMLLDSTNFQAGADFSVVKFLLSVTGGVMSCSARGQSIYRSLVQSMVREWGGPFALIFYRTLLRDLKLLMSIPASRTAYLQCQDGSMLTTQSGVPFQL